MSRLVRQKSPQISNTLLDIPKKPLWAPAEQKKTPQQVMLDWWKKELRATDDQIKTFENRRFYVANTTTEYLSNLKKILLLCKFKFEKSKELLKKAQEAIQAKNDLAQDHHKGIYSGNQNNNTKLTELKQTIEENIGNLLGLYEQDKEELDQNYDYEKKCSIM